MGRWGVVLATLTSCLFGSILFFNIFASFLILAGALKIGGFKLGGLLILLLLVWQASKVLPVLFGVTFWKYASAITAIFILFSWVIGQDLLSAISEMKNSSSVKSAIEMTVGAENMSKRRMLKTTPFYENEKGEIRGACKKNNERRGECFAVEGEVLFCSNAPRKSKEGQSLIQCMKRDSEGQFVGGDKGYVPASATVAVELAGATIGSNQPTTADYERLQAENQRLQSQLSNLQSQQRGEKAGLQGQIRSLQEQLADRDAKIGQLNASTAQAQAAQRAAEQNARQMERNWQGAEAKASRWERFTKECWQRCGRG
ncbi:MAG TPA: hypothetical protein GX706_01765 [Candidatus Moranbacteria bacterium]|nr:hypothetical protein [Candidatus Moranbacteria bacterium]